MITVLTEEVSHWEVIQLQTNTSNNTRLTPTKWKFNLVVWLLLKIIVDVYSTIFIVWNWYRINRLRIKVAHWSQFTCRTLKCFLREKVTWLCTQFTTNNILVKAVITINLHTIDTCLLSLSDTHFKVNRVADNIHLCWLQVIEEISIIPISITHSILILWKTLVQVSLVVHVALLHIEQTRQIVGWVNGITYPLDVTDIILLTLIYLYIDIYMLWINIPYTIFQNNSITISIFVILRDKVLLILSPTLRSELLWL